MQCAICEKDMFGAGNSSQSPIVCGSCVMTPLPSPEEVDSDENEYVDHDLSYLDDTEEKQRPEKKRTQRKGKYYTQVQTELTKMATQQPVPLQEVEPVKRLKIKSNFLRDRAYPIGDMTLHFDGDGVAEFPEHHMEQVKTHMRLRPGRFRLLETPKPKKDTKSLEDARAALEAAKAEKEPEPKVDSESATEATPEAPKAPEESKFEEKSKPAKVETSDKTSSKPKASRKTTKKSSKTKKSEES